MTTSTISIPLSAVADIQHIGNSPRNVCFTDADGNVMETLQRVRTALAANNVTLSNGGKVVRHVDAVRWLLEQIAINAQ